MSFQRSSDRSRRRKTAKRRGILHVPYRIGIKKQAGGDDDRRNVKTHKELRGKKFKSGMVLLVDQAKLGGCGTIDDGNSKYRGIRPACQETAGLLVAEYPRYCMPASVQSYCMERKTHCINSCKHVGECCRMSTNIDLIHSLLVSSDPFIVNVRPLPRKQTSGVVTRRAAIHITATSSAR